MNGKDGARKASSTIQASSYGRIEVAFYWRWKYAIRHEEDCREWLVEIPTNHQTPEVWNIVQCYHSSLWNRKIHIKFIITLFTVIISEKTWAAHGYVGCNTLIIHQDNLLGYIRVIKIDCLKWKVYQLSKMEITALIS